MIILAVDPGHTVGFAARTEDHVLAVGSIDHTVFLNLGVGVLGILIGNQPDLVVVEGVPQNKADAITSEVFRNVIGYCKALNIRCSIVVPGVWKPIMKGQKIDTGDHHRDALKLATYASQHLV